jgi:hypothetical protein
MSSWWDIEFTVSGEPARVAEFWQRLPDETTGFAGWRTAMNSPLFHHLEVIRQDEGSLTIKASRNYYGGEAIEEMILRNSDLVFTEGVLSHESAVQPMGTYYEWEARNGDFTKWETLTNWDPEDYLSEVWEQTDPDPLPSERERIKQIVVEAKQQLTPELLEQRRRLVAKLMAE